VATFLSGKKRPSRPTPAGNNLRYRSDIRKSLPGAHSSWNNSEVFRTQTRRRVCALRIRVDASCQRQALMILVRLGKGGGVQGVPAGALSMFRICRKPKERTTGKVDRPVRLRNFSGRRDISFSVSQPRPTQNYMKPSISFTVCGSSPTRN